MSSDSKFTDPPKPIFRARTEEWRKAREGVDLPEDLRDDIESTADSLRQPAGEIRSPSPEEFEEADTDDRPAENRRAVRPEDARQPTRDPSLSRDVDLKAAGGDPMARHGMTDDDVRPIDRGAPPRT